MVRQSHHGSLSPHRSFEDDREGFVSVGTPIALRAGRFSRPCCWGGGHNVVEDAGGKASEIIEVGSAVWSDLMGYECEVADLTAWIRSD